ncbi:MAG: right-handed parallel beta-helix repeat-containing protein [Planctomycetota bacterium]|jgi:hypothetical protein
MRKLVMIIAIVFLSLTVANSAMAYYQILDDATGGDCTVIGNWDWTTKTCTLTTDLFNLSEGIRLNRNITLDGNGHIIEGTGANTGVLALRSGTTVKNLNVSNFYYGIWHGNNATITDNSVSNCGRIGIRGSGAAYAIVTNNYVIDNFWGIFMENNPNSPPLWANINNNILKGNSYFGIFLRHTNQVSITNNQISSNANGIGLDRASYNNIYGNTVSYNNSGISIMEWFGGGSSTGNYVYNNNFIDNLGQAGVYVPSDRVNYFNHDKPIGGNYWSDLQGCSDADNDGFCDSPYDFHGGADYLPWAKQNGWLTPQVVIGGVISDVEALVIDGILSGGEGIALSATLDAAIKKFENGNITAACNTLGAFFNKVEAKINARILTAEEGQALIDAATVNDCN